MKKFLVLASAICLLLSGCVSKQETAIIQAQPNQAGTAVVGAVPIVNKTVLSGETIELFTTSAINPDCTPAAMNTLRITQQPMHGTAEIIHRDVYPSFPPLNPRSACNKTKVAGIAVNYTANAGFTGSDILTFQIFTHSGGETESKVVITVK